MAADVISGVGGTATVGSLIANVHEWVIVVEAAEFDATTFADGDWADFVYGLVTGSITLTAYGSATESPAMPGAQATVVLSDGGTTYDGTMKVGRVTHTTPKAGMIGVVMEGKFSGRPRITPSPSPSSPFMQP